MRFHMTTTKLGRRALSTFAALQATLALAQTPPTVVITFDSVATGVPVGGVATWLAALGIVAVALWFARRHGGVARAALSLVAAAGVAVVASFSSPNATAITQLPYIINIVTSPTAVIFGSAPSGSSNYTMQFNNTTGQQITLRGVTLNNPGGLSIGLGTTCTVGLVMPAAASCVVQLQETQPS